jgi:hypothetical protein
MKGLSEAVIEAKALLDKGIVEVVGEDGMPNWYEGNEYPEE